ncbi:MAG: alpha/beta fold hydrolase [Lacunisphaera sp.]|nr:alpha/beta fold hydrolase [Lacunisphaera sp.]
MKKLLLLAPLTFLLSASLPAADTKPGPAASPASTFVIVHGAWGGGWAFREVDRLLTADGHQVHRPTLTGQGEKVHLASPAIGLTTHVDDIVNVILYEDLHDVVLVGHSYGGMVITGVMDRIPERLRQVVFLDAAVPEDGESASAVFNHPPTPEQLATGFVIPAWVKPNTPPPHDVPQSLKTWTEPVTYRNPAAQKLPGTYVAFVGPGQKGDSRPAWQRAKARGWSVLTLESDHNAQWSHPKELVALLEQIAATKL